jgi:hypothetical protein
MRHSHRGSVYQRQFSDKREETYRLNLGLLNTVFGLGGSVAGFRSATVSDDFVSRSFILLRTEFIATFGFLTKGLISFAIFVNRGVMFSRRFESDHAAIAGDRSRFTGAVMSAAILVRDSPSLRLPVAIYPAPFKPVMISLLFMYSIYHSKTYFPCAVMIRR